MDNEERIRRLKQRFADVFPQANCSLVITTRTVKGELRTYFTATNCHRREALGIIQGFFPNAYGTSRNHVNNIFKFRADE